MQRVAPKIALRGFWSPFQPCCFSLHSPYIRPRPGLTASAENLRLSGETPASRLQEFGVTVAQPVELGNRKALRMEVAERSVSVSEARLTEVLRRQLFDLKRTYYESVLSRALLGIEQENCENFEGLVQFNKARFEEGYIAEGELLKVRLERIKFDFAVANAELAFRKTKIRLLELRWLQESGRRQHGSRRSHRAVAFWQS